MSICEQCKLSKFPKVVSRGPLDAPVVIVGQSPGAEELQVGRPFVGPSGRLLEKALAEAGIDSSKLLFTNAVRCSDGNTPDRKTIDLCHHHLIALLSAHPRRLIIALGNEAWYTLCGGTVGGAIKGQGKIAKARDGDWDVLWNLHPAYILRNESAYPNWVDHFRRAKAILDGVLDRVSPEVEIIAPGHLPVDHLTDEHWAVGADIIAFDVETTGLCFWRDQLIGVGLADSERAVYIALRHSPDIIGSPLSGMVDMIQVPSKEEWEYIQDWLRIVFKFAKRVVAHNSKFDAKFLLYHLGVDPRPIWLDTMLAHHLIDENAPHSLKAIGQTWLMVENWEDEVEKSKSSGGLHREPVEVVAKYCGADAVVTAKIAPMVEERLKDEGCVSIYRHMVGPLSDELVDVELRGLLVDKQTLDQLGSVMRSMTEELANKIRSLSGYGDGTCCPWRGDDQDGMNPNSTADLINILYTEHGFGIEPTQFTEKGSPSTSEEALQQILERRVSKKVTEFVNTLLHYRKLVKIDRTYIAGMGQYINPSTNTVHTNFMFNPNTEDSPRTGRLSSSYPNLQNQPKEVRPIFVPRPGYKFWEADQSNLEVRVWAALSQDPGLIDIFYRSQRGEIDYHTMVASVCFDVPYDKVTTEQRSIAKVVTFGGVMYGGDEWVIARAMGSTPEEAKVLLSRLFGAFPQGQEWLQNQVRHAFQRGYVVSPLGRKRRIPEINSDDPKIRSHAERVAKNSCIQGLASDINNMAMLRIAHFIRENGIDAYIVNIVHDSILVEVNENQVEEVAPHLKALMEEPPWEGFGVPLQVDDAITDRWGGELDVNALIGQGG